MAVIFSLLLCTALISWGTVGTVATASAQAATAMGPGYALPAGLPVSTFSNPTPLNCSTVAPTIVCQLSHFGQALALNGDGSEVAIGNSNYDEVAVYAETNGQWPSEPTVLLKGPTGFGSAVALSSDGQTLAVGAAAGEVLVFSQIDGNWPSAPSTAIATPGASLGGPQGDVTSVALSADGTTLATSGSPAAIYAMSSGDWPASPSATFSPGGAAVALSADGQTLLIGSPSSVPYGAAYLYDESAGQWPGAPSATIPSPYLFSTAFGFSVALSANGQTALVGDPAYHVVPGEGPIGAQDSSSGDGAAFVYAAADGSWPSAPVVSFVGDQDEELGQYVGLSGDGSLGLVSAPYANSTYLYQATSGTWETSPVEAFGPTAGEVAMSGDGLSVLVARDGSSKVALYISNGARADPSGAIPLALVTGSTSYGDPRSTFAYRRARGSPALAGSLVCTAVYGGRVIGPALGAGTYTVDGSRCSGLYASGVPGPAAAAYEGLTGGFTVSGEDQSVQFTNAAPTFGRTGETAVGQTWVPRARATGGSNVTFEVGVSRVPGTCSLQSGVVHFRKAGACVIVAQAPAGGRYNAGRYVVSVYVHSLAQMALHLQAPVQARAGGLVGYILRMTDSGPGPAAGALVQLVLPAGTSLVSVRPKPFKVETTPTPGTSAPPGKSRALVIWYAATLAKGSSATFRLVARAPKRVPATLTATADISMVAAGSIDPRPSLATARISTAVRK